MRAMVIVPLWSTKFLRSYFNSWYLQDDIRSVIKPIRPTINFIIFLSIAVLW